MTKILSLPHEIEEFDALINERIENFTNKKSCVTIMRCIPEINLQAWEEINNNCNNDEWIAVEVDLENAQSNDLLKTIYSKAKNYNSTKNLNLSQCLVQANEKHFLYFGHEQDAPQQ